MSSLRMVSCGFLLCMATLPAFLLTIARDHPAGSGAAAATAVMFAGDNTKAPRAWAGAPKPKPAASASTPTPQTAAPASSTADRAVLVELYLPDDQAAAMSREVFAAQPRALVLVYGPAIGKTEAGNGIDPYVGVEAKARRGEYARALGGGDKLAGPVVVMASASLAAPAEPTAKWASVEAVKAAAAADGPRAELTLKVISPAAGSGKTALRAEFALTGEQAKSIVTDDAMLRLALVEPMSPDAGAPLRVVAFKSLKLPRSGAGTVEIAPPTGSKATRLIAMVQHNKTMRLIASADSAAK